MQTHRSALNILRGWGRGKALASLFYPKSTLRFRRGNKHLITQFNALFSAFDGSLGIGNLLSTYSLDQLSSEPGGAPKVGAVQVIGYGKPNLSKKS